MNMSLECCLPLSISIFQPFKFTPCFGALTPFGAYKEEQDVDGGKFEESFIFNQQDGPKS